MSEGGDFLGHVACVKCDSSNALSVYRKTGDDGEYTDGYCFSCESYVTPTELGNEYEFTTQDNRSRIKVESIEYVKDFRTSGIKERRLKTKYCEMYGVKMETNDDNEVIKHYYPVTKSGVITGYKVRELPKKFSAIGDTKKSELFGQHLFTGRGEYANKVSKKFVIVTEGECFTENCEVMTPTGFRSIKDVVENREDVVAVNENLEAVRETPIAYIEKEYEDDLIEMKGDRYYSLTTKNHKLLSNSGGKTYVETASEIYHHRKIPTSAILAGCDGVPLSNDEIALIIAVVADFKLDVKKSGVFRCHGEFKKERKVERLTELLERLGVESKTYDKMHTPMERVTFNFDAPSFLQKSLEEYGKLIPDHWHVKMTQEQRMFVLRELGYWDGHIGGRGYDMIEFTSSHKSEVVKVQQICSVSGVHSKVSSRSNKFGEWWRVQYYFDKKDVSLQSVTKRSIPYKGVVYCVQTLSGFLITRQNNIVSISGNCDAIALQQTMSENGRGYINAVVSLPNGANTRAVKDNYEFLNEFESVIIALDQDEQGERASKEIAQILPMGKAKIARFSEKDPCDMVVRGKGDELSKIIWTAKSFTPSGIVAGEGLWEAVRKPLDQSSIPYPWKGLNEVTHGIRTSELVTLVSGSGMGKSEFARAVMYHILKTTDDNVGGMFLEESTRKTGLALMSFEAKKLLHLPHVQRTDEELKEAFNATLGSGRVFLFDSFGSNDIDTICSNISYFAKVADCKYIFLDHVSIMVSGGGYGDERKALDEIATKLRTLVQELDISLFIISHLKRVDGDGHEQGGETSLSHIRGSAGIGQLSDMVLGLERNNQHEDPQERNTTTIRVLKNRFSGNTGKAARVHFNPITGELTEVFTEEGDVFDNDDLIVDDGEVEVAEEQPPWDFSA